MTRVHDLLDLPKAVRKGDFVQSLAGGIETPDKTVRDLHPGIQEEIDGRVYGLFDLPTLTADRVDDVLVPIAPEHRPMEVRLARDLDLDISAASGSSATSAPRPTTSAVPSPTFTAAAFASSTPKEPTSPGDPRDQAPLAAP